MFLDVDEKKAEKEMIGCQVAMSYIVVMQWLEMYVNRQLSAGMVAQAVGATMTIAVGDGQASQRHEPTDSDIMARDCAARGTPWQPPWSPHAVLDTATVELQGRLWHGRNDVVVTPYEPRRWEQTGGAPAERLEARPGQNCRVLSAQATPPGNGSSRRWHNDEGDVAGRVQRNNGTCLL